ncbi:hypothetical protein BDZ89DRAFT_1072106, partial [Hymenopellis radicata]
TTNLPLIFLSQRAHCERVSLRDRAATLLDDDAGVQDAGWPPAPSCQPTTRTEVWIWAGWRRGRVQLNTAPIIPFCCPSIQSHSSHLASSHFTTRVSHTPSQRAAQISATVRNQIILSVIGVPVALIAGYLVELPILGRRGTLSILTLLTGAFILASTTARS